MDSVGRPASIAPRGERVFAVDAAGVRRPPPRNRGCSLIASPMRNVRRRRTGWIGSQTGAAMSLIFFVFAMES